MSMNQLKKKYNYEWLKIRHKCKSEEVGSKSEGVGANTDKKDIGRRAVKEVMLLTQILLCTFLSN